MKKIKIPIIVLFLSLIFTQSYALDGATYIYQDLESIHWLGYFNNETEALTAMDAYMTDVCPCDTSIGDCAYGVYITVDLDCDDDGTNEYQGYGRQVSGCTSCGSRTAYNNERVFSAWPTDSDDNCHVLVDSDGDGTAYDLYPDDPTSYKGAISAICYNTSTGEVVAGEITTSLGDIFSFGEIPSDYNGYTVSTIDSGLVLKNTDDLAIDLENAGVDELTFEPKGSGIDIADDGTIFIPGNSIGDTWNDQTEADEPDEDLGTNFNEGSQATGTETDSEALGSIINNTGKTADNVKRLGDYLKIGNDYLAKMTDRLNNIKTGSSSGTSVTVNTEGGPTAQEIADAIGAELDDVNEVLTGQPDPSDSAPTRDDTLFFTNFKTQVHNVWTDFQNDLYDTDLWKLPYDMLPSIPSGGNSLIQYEVGLWGSPSQHSITIDVSDYSSVWDIMKILLPILTGLAVIKILILKQA